MPREFARPGLNIIRIPYQRPAKETWIEPMEPASVFAFDFIGANARTYTLPLAECFAIASKQYPSVSIDTEIMAGAPCIRGTRIPIYMIVDAVDQHGSLDGALRSYPRLSIEQVKDALGFAKLVIECPLIDEATSPAG